MLEEEQIDIDIKKLIKEFYKTHFKERGFSRRNLKSELQNYTTIVNTIEFTPNVKGRNINKKFNEFISLRGIPIESAQTHLFERIEILNRLKDLKKGAWIKKGDYALSLLRKIKNLTGKKRRKIITLGKRKIEVTKFSQTAFQPHWKEEPSVDFIKFRDSYDEALTQLSLLEIAATTSYLPLKDIEPIARNLMGILLFNKNAINYIVDYDYFLIRFLAQRIGINLNLKNFKTIPPIKHLEHKFGIFLSSYMNFEVNPNIDLFLSFLDDYCLFDSREAEIEDLIEFLETGEIDSEGNKYYQMYIEDLSLGYFEFVDELYNFFQNLQKTEVIYFGLHYSYWLGRFFGFDTNKSNKYYRRKKLVDWSEVRFTKFKRKINSLKSNWEKIYHFINES